MQNDNECLGWVLILKILSKYFLRKSYFFVEKLWILRIQLHFIILLPIFMPVHFLWIPDRVASLGSYHIARFLFLGITCTLVCLARSISFQQCPHQYWLCIHSSNLLFPHLKSNKHRWTCCGCIKLSETTKWIASSIVISLQSWLFTMLKVRGLTLTVFQ